MPELSELVSLFGPIGGILLFMWLNRDKNKADAPKDDGKIHEVHTMTIEILTILRERRR